MDVHSFQGCIHRCRIELHRNAPAIGPPFPQGLCGPSDSGCLSASHDEAMILRAGSLQDAGRSLTCWRPGTDASFATRLIFQEWIALFLFLTKGMHS